MAKDIKPDPQPVLGPGLKGAKTLPRAAVRPNLPPQLTPLIGREKEIATVAAKLQDPGVRLLTLTGPGGIGKTRLAMAAAEQLLDQFPDGVCFVSLAALRDPAFVASTIGQMLDLREMGAKPVFEMLRDHLRDKVLLLLLDNFEPVVEAAPRMAELLAVCPDIKLLVTSREALRLSVEHQFAVSPLSQPEDSGPLSVRRMSQYGAIQLFVDRAQAVKSDFVLTEANAPAVAEICRRVDGLPLAIQLAAARVNFFSPQALLARLDQPLKLLTGGPRDLPERQQTIRNTIAWSYDLLGDPEKRLFRRLSVFAGGCTLEAAAAVGDPHGDLGIDVAEGMESLAAKSLLRVEEGEEPRFTMLETVREYGQEAWKSGSEEGEIEEQHARFFLNLARRGSRGVWSTSQLETLARLDRDVDNFRAALRWSLDTGDLEVSLRLAGALEPFWWMRGMLREGRAWLEKAFAASDTTPTGSRAWALYSLADILARQGDLATACLYVDEGLAIHRSLGNAFGIAVMAWQRGMLAIYRGEFAVASSLLEESLVISRALKAELQIGTDLRELGFLALFQGDYVTARSRLEESLAVLRGTGERIILAQAVLFLAIAMVEQREYRSARSLLEEGLGLLREIGERWSIAWVLHEFAALASALGRAERSARLIGSAEALGKAIGMEASWLSNIDVFLSPRRNRVAASTLASLGEERFAVAFAEGNALSLDQVIAYALEPDEQDRPPGEGPRKRWLAKESQLLSRREREVALLVAQGLSSRQIAGRLVLSLRTVDSHAASILRKLGLTSRIQLAAWAAERGLLERRPDEAAVSDPQSGNRGDSAGGVKLASPY